MSAKLEKIENSEAYLNIEVDAATFEEGLQKSYKKVVKQVALPGFRKGRVPRELLEAHFGREILFEDALEFVVPGAYEEALAELNIDPIAQPEFEFEEIEADNVLKFTAKVAVKPEVTLGQLEGIEVEVSAASVCEEDVDNRMEEMSTHYAQLIEKTDEAAAYGDIVTIDFEGFIDGEAFEGGAGEDYQLELGSNTFIPGFEDQLVGIKAGESTDVAVHFPDAYHAEELAGKPAVFKVIVHKIENKKPRELDDEFAQEVSNFDTIAELREDVKKNLELMVENRKKGLAREEVLSKAVDLCQIEVPGAVVKMQLNSMLQQFADRLRMQGLSIDQYFQLTGRNVDRFNEEMWPEAEKSVRTNFMLEKIAEEKGFTVSDEELDTQIQEIAASMGMDSEQAKQNLAGVMDEVIDRMKLDKAVQYLVDNAVIKEIDPTEEEIATADEPEA